MIYDKKLTLNSLLVKFDYINSLLVTERFMQLLILGIRSSVGYGFTFQTIVQQNKSIILSSFLSLYPKYSWS